MVAMPEVASDINVLRVTELRYQPFEPAVPVRVPVILGGWVSTLAVNVPITELSPNEESAQYAKLFGPWFKGTLQLEFMQAKVCPFRVPSIAKML